MGVAEEIIIGGAMCNDMKDDKIRSGGSLLFPPRCLGLLQEG